MNINDIIARSESLRKETALNAIDPERVGSIMSDTLKWLNEFQLTSNSLGLDKIYSSVDEMNSDAAPVSDLTGKPLKAGQLAVIVASGEEDEDNGKVYRFDNPGWTYVSIIGNLNIVQKTGNSETAVMSQKAVTDYLNAGYLYKGIANPSTDPGTPDQNVFYLAAQAGTYTNFGGIEVRNELVILRTVSSGGWTRQVLTEWLTDKYNMDWGLDGVSIPTGSRWYNFGRIIAVNEGDKFLLEISQADGLVAGNVGIALLDENGDAICNADIGYFVSDTGVKQEVVQIPSGVSGISGIYVASSNTASTTMSFRVAGALEAEIKSLNLGESLPTLQSAAASDGAAFDRRFTLTRQSATMNFEKILTFHKGDKLYLELENITFDEGVSPYHVTVTWNTPSGYNLTGKLDFYAGNTLPIVKIFEIDEDIQISGVTSIFESSGSVSMDVRAAGMYKSDLYELANEVESLTNKYNIERVFKRTGVNRSNYLLELGTTLNLKSGDAIYLSFDDVELTGDGFIAMYLDQHLGLGAIQYRQGDALPKGKIYEISEDIEVSAINIQITSGTRADITVRFGGVDVVKLQMLEDKQVSVTRITATRNAADYNSIRDIIANISDAGAYHQYEIFVPKGRWFESDLYGKDFVKIIGEDMNDTVIYCDGNSTNVAPEGYYYSSDVGKPLNEISIDHKHVIFVRGENFSIENCTVEATQCKYCMHIDATGKREVTASHVIFDLKSGNNVVGIGIWASQKLNFSECYFKNETENTYDVYLHDWNNQTDISSAVFRNCLFSKSYINLGELGADVSVNVDITNCQSLAEAPTIYYHVQSTDGHSYWIDPSTGQPVTDLTLVPYSIKVNIIGTYVDSITQQYRPNYMEYIIGKLQA